MLYPVQDFSTLRYYALLIEAKHNQIKTAESDNECVAKFKSDQCSEWDRPAIDDNCYPSCISIYQPMYGNGDL